MVFIGALLFIAVGIASTAVLACCAVSSRAGDSEPLPTPVTVGSSLDKVIA